MADPITKNIGDWLEVYTYEYLLMMGLSQVPDTVDKRQGSIIWDAIAPAAYIIAEVASQMRQVYRDTFVATATGEYLDLRAAEIGLTRREATFAVRKGYFYDANGALMDVPVDSRYAARNNSNNLTFTVSSEIASEGEVHEVGIFFLTCDTAGKVGNQYSGDLVPITNIQGLARAVLGEVIITARDRETDDELRQRYYDKMNEKPFGGNVAHYKLWMSEIDGVGGSQIYPIWNGGGTVKISIVNNEYYPVEPEFIEIVQRMIDPQDILPDPIIRYYGGDPMHFEAGVNQIATVRVIGRTTQEGTGTPSESNVRPISGVRRNPAVYVNGTANTFNTSGPLYSIPVPGGTDIADDILKTNGLALARETRNTRLLTLDGSAAWQGEPVATSYMVFLPTANLKITGATVNTLSSHFRPLIQDELTAGLQGCCVTDRNGSAIALCFAAGSGVNSVASFQSWMTGKTVQMLVQLETPDYADQSGIGDVQNQAGRVVINADDDANLTVGVIDKVDTSQLGIGIAPIGHQVTIVTPTEFEIDISAVIVTSAGYDPASVQTSVERSIGYYFDTVRAEWGRSNDLNLYNSVVYQSNVIVQILAVPGVVSVTSCLLNGQPRDVILTENSTTQELPLLGQVTLSA